MIDQQWSRRRLLTRLAPAALGAALATPAILRPVGARAAGGQIVVGSFGGGWADAMTEAFHKPFTEATGIKVVVTEGTDLAKAKAMLQTGNLEWDTIELVTGWLST